MNTRLTKGILGTVAGGLMLLAITASADYVPRFIASDPPPFEGRKQAAETQKTLEQMVRSIASEIENDNLERRIEATCGLIEAARGSNAVTLLGGLSAQLTDYQAQHKRTTGDVFPVQRDCQ